jgi:hypothetical protein
VEEEELSFGRPSRQTKRPRHHPEPDSAVLQSGSSTPAFPHSPAYSAPPKPPPVPLSPPSNLGVISDSEEEWDEVAAPPAHGPISIDVGDGNDGDGSDEEEIDMNAFEAEMNQELGVSEDDFLAAAVSSEPEIVPTARPMSLHQFAGGGEASQDDDDYSSSEESDED